MRKILMGMHPQNHSKIGLFLSVFLGIQMPILAMSLDAILNPFASKTGLALSTIGLGAGMAYMYSVSKDLDDYAMDNETLGKLNAKMKDSNDNINEDLKSASDLDKKIYKNMPYAENRIGYISLKTSHNNLSGMVNDIKRALHIDTDTYMTYMNTDYRSNVQKESDLKYATLFFLHAKIFSTCNQESCERVINTLANHVFGFGQCYYQDKRRWFNRPAGISCGDPQGKGQLNTIDKQMVHISSTAIPDTRQEIKENIMMSNTHYSIIRNVTFASACCLGIGIYRWLK